MAQPVRAHDRRCRPSPRDGGKVLSQQIVELAVAIWREVGEQLPLSLHPVFDRCVDDLAAVVGQAHHCYDRRS
jgi:hypothetical protein